MRKTSVYLTEEQAEGLRRIALDTGKAQADLIRDAVQRVIDESPAPQRVFHSMGIADSGAARSEEGWDADELYEWVMGRGR
ncbi:MAG: ribbon-helix-helix protein, CopG family [Chloroflexi bacterium]|nr:ribbon-helix-helix protein, CopG family [Chloroflexota bacterium]